MSKIILINPAIDLAKFGKFKHLMEPMPPIGLSYLAAVLKQNQIEVTVIDDFALNYGLERIVARIEKEKPDFVGISCLTPCFPYIEKICARIKALNSDIKIVLGNIHASLFAEEILKRNTADFVVHGDGEYTLLELISNYPDREKLKTISGLSFKDNNQLIKKEPVFIPDLDALPYPEWSLFPYQKYGLLPFVSIERPVLTLTASRGCPYNCDFCSLKHSGGNYRKRSPEAVVEELKFLIEKYHIKQFGFVDPIFPLEKQHCLDICRLMINEELDPKINWICETRVDKLDQEILEQMKAAGCKRILLGIESGSQKTLDNISKKFQVDKVLSTIRLIKNIGLEVTGLFMIGFPKETKTDIEETIKLATSLPLDFAKFALTIPLPGSKLYENLVKEENFKRTDWENFYTFNPDPENLVYVPETLTGKELIALQKKANRKFYFRLRTIFNLLFKIKTLRLKDIFYGIYALLS